MMYWVVSSTMLILMIVILRFLLKGKISLRLQYALWAIVLARLLIPFSIGEVVISVGNWIEHLSQKEEMHAYYEFLQSELPTMSYQQAYEEVADRYESQGIDIENISEEEIAENIDDEIKEVMTGRWTLVDIMKMIWLIGGIVVGTWFFFSNFCFYRKLLKGRKLFLIENVSIRPFMKRGFMAGSNERCIYVCDGLDTPCLFGLWHPAIYVPSGIVENETMFRHVIVHETTHVLHRDYIWGYLRALCLIIHWYNPFVWYAAYLSKLDAELACDEATIERLGETERAAYGLTLMDLTCERRPEMLLTATTMTSSGKLIKERITMIVKKPKMKGYVGILVMIAAVLCMGCTFTGADVGTEKKDSEIVAEDDETGNKNTVIGTIIEDPDELREVEHQQGQLRVYENMKKGALVADEAIINRIKNLLQEENKFEFMLNCEYGYDDSKEVYQMNGKTVFLVDEVSTWAEYEKMAGEYYAESYIKNEFTPFFFGNVYMEADGKLYRTIADGIVNPILPSTIEIYEMENGKAYVAVVMMDAIGRIYSNGYILELSEDSTYGFKIVEKW